MQCFSCHREWHETFSHENDIKVFRDFSGMCTAFHFTLPDISTNDCHWRSCAFLTRKIPTNNNTVMRKQCFSQTCETHSNVYNMSKLNTSPMFSVTLASAVIMLTAFCLLDFSILHKGKHWGEQNERVWFWMSRKSEFIRAHHFVKVTSHILLELFYWGKVKGTSTWWNKFAAKCIHALLSF